MADLIQAQEWIEHYFEDGEKCKDCHYYLLEPDVNHHECNCEDPTDCPALPESFFPEEPNEN